MSEEYRIFGSELSPYSVKVRSYFRYKKIPHEWVIRNTQSEEEFQRFARLPLVPLVVTPDGRGIQDSTPIIEHFETLYPEPSIHPGDPATAFLSALIEEYADEWGNKPSTTDGSTSRIRRARQSAWRGAWRPAWTRSRSGVSWGW
jgi:glutathione S-transferase